MIRGPVSLVIVGGGMLGMVALLFGGPRVFEKVLPEAAISWLETMGTDGTISGLGGDGSGGFLGFGGASAAKGKGDDPMSRLRDTSDGWAADGKVTTLQGGGLAFVADVIDGYSARVRDDAPGTVEVLADLQGCAFTPPSADAHIGHASAGARTPVGLATYNDGHIAAAVQGLVNAYRETGMTRTSKGTGLRYEVFDVAVTETARPVYLVLEAMHGLPVFNIHLAPGARIERVALIGGDQIGVANLPEGVPVEVMRRAAAETCGAMPFYPLNPGALYYQSVEIGAIRPEEVPGYEARFAASQEAWEGFFRANFGVGAHESLSGDVDDVTLATVGPVPANPEARAVWAPVEGAPVRVTVDQYLEYPGQAEGEDFDSRVKAVARAFAWGDLANLAQGVAF